jgi:hypothetical protein
MINSFKEFIFESRFISKKNYKKGDIVETANGTKYYVNGVTPELEELWKRFKGLGSYEFAKRKINIVYSKYFTEDSDVAAETRSWFDNKQPSENQVRNAMIWSYDQFGDYSIKCGGESNADHIYTSHLRTEIMNPKTGEDQDVVVLKKFSTNFKDVLITIEEIQELQDLTETQQVRTARKKEYLRGVISILIRHEAGYPTAEGKNGKKIMSPDKWIIDLYDELKNEYTKDEILTHLNHIEKTFKEDMECVVQVFNKETGNYDEMKEKDHSPFYEKKLKALDIIKKKISLL